MNRLTTFLGRFCVLAALIASPWANVGVDARNFRVFLYLALASGVFALVSLWTTPRRERRTNSYFGTLATAIPLTLGLALAVAQILPTSAETLARLSPRVLELKAELLPPDFDEAPDAPALDAFADPEFRAPAWLDEAKEAALREALSEPFPFDAEAPLDLQSATAVDAAVERAFLPADAPARNAWGRTLSVYPLATRQMILVFGTALIIFFSAAILFNTTASRRFLWSAVALNGLAVALFCLAGRANPAIFENEAVADWLGEKRFTPLERLFVDVESVRPAEANKEIVATKARYGMYVCKNAAAGYLVLCLATALGLAVSAFLKTARLLEKERAERKRERAEEERWSDVYEIRRDAFWKRTLGDFFDLFDRRFVAWSCVAGVIFGAIFASLSRGASVAAFVGFVGALIVLAIRKEGRRYWPAVAAVGAVGLALVVWTGLAQRVDARMATLVEEDFETGETAVEGDPRWDNWRAAAETSREYPWLGSGLGTYSIANYANDEALQRGALFYYAENSFVQTRLEMGNVGVLLYVLTYVALLISVGRALVGKRSRETLAVGCGGLCLILGQFVASMGDFGIYFSANLFLFAALCGSCVARKNVRQWEKWEAARAKAETRARAVREEGRAARREAIGAAATSALLLVVLLGGRWALSENADAVERTRLLDGRDEIKRLVKNVDSATLSNDKDLFFALPSSGTLDVLIDETRSFVDRRDDSYEVRAALAYLELTRFRVVRFEALREAEPTATDQELWARTAPEYWEAALRHYRRLGFDGAAASIRSEEAIAEAFPQILADWTAARRVCPLEVASHMKIAETLATATPIVWAREREAVELAARRTAKAAAFDSTALFNAGRELFRVDANALWPKFWRRSAEFSFARWRSILNAIELGVPASKQEAVVAKIMPNDPTAARVALSHCWGRRGETSLFAALLKNAETVFETTPQEKRDDVYYAERAYFNKFSENYEAAEADWRKALKLRPDSFEFKLQLAILLCEQTRLLQKDEECVKLLREVAESASGSRANQAKTWLQRAERNLLRSQARAKRAEKERSQEESAAPTPSSEDSETSE